MQPSSWGLEMWGCRCLIVQQQNLGVSKFSSSKLSPDEICPSPVMPVLMTFIDQSL